ncbi:MAG: fatty acid desaturase family protein [Woeseiaceae bacterium]
MAKVQRIDGEALFGRDEWAALNRRSAWRGIAMVAHAWLIIVLAFGIAVVTQHPLVIAIAALVIGSRQLGLTILMHEGAHGLLTDNKRLNDILGHWFCAFPTGLDMFAYRAYHLKHHRFAQQDEDPDLVLSAPFPVTRWSLARKTFRDLTGLTFLKLRVLPLFLALFGRRKWHFSDSALLGSSILIALVCYAAGCGWAFWILWLLPYATWQMWVTRLRNISEHAGTTRDNDAWRVARTTRAGVLARIFIAPYHVNFHAEHHLFMWTPCYRLPRIHAELRRKGEIEANTMSVAPSYRHVLQEVTL